VSAVPCVGIGGHRDRLRSTRVSEHSVLSRQSSALSPQPSVVSPPSSLTSSACLGLNHTHPDGSCVSYHMVCHPSSSKSFNRIPSRVTRRPCTVPSVFRHPQDVLVWLVIIASRKDGGSDPPLLFTAFAAYTAHLRICIPHHLATIEE
jgi:hypothetical protein